MISESCSPLYSKDLSLSAEKAYANPPRGFYSLDSSFSVLFASGCPSTDFGTVLDLLWLVLNISVEKVAPPVMPVLSDLGAVRF